MQFPVFSRLSPSQALLFTPAAMLAALGLIVVRNCFSRPVVRAEDSPSGDREAVILIEYPLAFPFAGQVEAVLQLRSLPDHQTFFTRRLGQHRWFSEASAAYAKIEWSGPGRLTLRAADGSSARSLYYDTRSPERGGDR